MTIKLKLQKLIRKTFCITGVICTGIILILLSITTIKAEETAAQLDISIVLPQGQAQSKVKDNSYSTKATLYAGSETVVTSQDNMYGIYIKWSQIPTAWQLSYNGKSIECGVNGFLHEYVEIPEGSKSITITGAQQNSICEISAYSKGSLPSDVQVWEPQCKEADILVLSAHADDEVLFLGGALVLYAGQEELSAQVVYFSDYFNGTVIREHEKLDGLWVMGVKNYPINAEFEDIYAQDLASAEKIFNYDKTLEFVVEQIRRFKPLVCIAQDTKGEYGHGTHMLTSKAMQEAVNISMDKSQYPESAQKYGAYDVPKTYIHLYEDNKLLLDCQKPLSKFNDKNAVEVASEAYKQHVSQQWCWFYVSDNYEYSCADFGLFRTTVGYDTGNNMFENLETYEAKAIRLEKEELDRKKQEEEQRLLKEQESIQQQQIIDNQTDNMEEDSNYVYIAWGVLIAVLICIVCIAIIKRKNYNKR